MSEPERPQLSPYQVELQAGKRYTVRFKQDLLAGQTFVYDPESLRSEAVHVSHLGFRPDDPAIRGMVLQVRHLVEIVED